MYVCVTCVCVCVCDEGMRDLSDFSRGCEHNSAQTAVREVGAVGAGAIALDPVNASDHALARNVIEKRDAGTECVILESKSETRGKSAFALFEMRARQKGKERDREKDTRRERERVKERERQSERDKEKLGVCGCTRECFGEGAPVWCLLGTSHQGRFADVATHVTDGAHFDWWPAVRV